MAHVTRQERVVCKFGNSHSSITYSLIPIADKVNMFFPGYKSKFIMETVTGDIETQVTPALRGTPVGERGLRKFGQCAKW